MIVHSPARGPLSEWLALNPSVRTHANEIGRIHAPASSLRTKRVLIRRAPLELIQLQTFTSRHDRWVAPLRFTWQSHSVYSDAHVARTDPRCRKRSGKIARCGCVDSVRIGRLGACAPTHRRFHPMCQMAAPPMEARHDGWLRDRASWYK